MEIKGTNTKEEEEGRKAGNKKNMKNHTQKKNKT